MFSKELGQVTLGLWIWMSAQQFSHETGLGAACQCPSFDLILSECIMEEESCKETLRLSNTPSSLCRRARICEIGTQYCPLHCYSSLCVSSHFSWTSNISNEVSALAFDISTQANSHECLVLESYSEILAGSALMRVRYRKSHSKPLYQFVPYVPAWVSASYLNSRANGATIQGVHWTREKQKTHVFNFSI